VYVTKGKGGKKSKEDLLEGEFGRGLVEGNRFQHVDTQRLGFQKPEQSATTGMARNAYTRDTSSE
jgi:hypothetical protein